MHSPQALLIAGLLDLGTLKPAIEARLTEDHFPEFQNAWKAIERYNRRMGRPPSREVMGTLFIKLEWPEGQADHVEGLVERVRQDKLARELGMMVREVGHLLTQENEPELALELLTTQVRQFSTHYQSQEKDLDLIGDWQFFLDDAKDRIVRATSSGCPGITTGFKSLDKISGGLEPTELVTAVARQGEGKSWMLLYMACCAALQGKRVNFHPLEMSPTQVAFRAHVIFQCLLGVEEKFKNSSLTQGRGYSPISYESYLKLLTTKIPGSFQICDGRRSFSPTSVLAKIQEHHPDVVFVDYLTLMAPTGRGLENWSDVRMLTSELKSIAMDHQVPVVVAAQANRVATTRRGPPELPDIAFGDAIGMDSDRVISFKRSSSRVTHARLIKYRHGADRRDFYLQHDYNYGLVKEIDEGTALEMIENDKGQED